jgi:bacillithiol system protein YtxJ
MDELRQAIDRSNDLPVVLFKHSTRCGISSSAKRRLIMGKDQLGGRIEIFYLDLITYRDISNHIASHFGIVHQSPQIIVIQNGKAVQSASHESVSTDFIESII